MQITGLLVLVLALGLAVAACDRRVAGGRADGAEIYREVCARCHGARGVPPPELVSSLGVRDLSAAEFQDRVSDEQIRDQIAHGSVKKGMPGFAGALTEEQLTAVTGHVRGLRKADQRK